MDITIRTATTADLAPYTRLLQQTYEHAYADATIGLTADCFSPAVFASKDTQEYLQYHLIDTDMQRTWLALEKDRLIGAITCIIRNDQEAELTGFYVHPSFQGRGIGKKLYQQALEFARDRDLVLDVYCHNTKTIDLYTQWGWVLDTSRGDHGYFFRHWPQWPEGLQAKCMYMKLQRHG